MKKIIIPIIILLSIFFSFKFIEKKGTIKLLPFEKKWITENKNKKITVYYTGERDSFFYEDRKTGEIRGVYADFFRKIYDDTGIDFELKPLERAAYKEIMNKNSETAIFLKAARTGKREEKYKYLQMFNSYSLKLVIPEKIKDIEKWEDKRIAAIEGTSEEKSFTKFYPNIKLSSYVANNIHEVYKEAKEDGIELFLVKSDYIKEPHEKFIDIPDIDREYYYMGIHKSSPELIGIVEKYMEKVQKESLQNMISKNKIDFYKQVFEGDPKVEKLRKQYSKLVVLLPADKLMMPFYQEKNGKYTGYIPQKYEDIGKIIGIPLEFVHLPDNPIDKIPFYNIKAISFFSTPGYIEQMPYYNTIRVVLGDIGSDYITDKRDLKDSKVGIKKSVGLDISDYPKGKEFSTYEEGLKKLIRGEFDYLIGEYRIISNLMSELHLREKFKIIGIFPERFKIVSEIHESEKDLIEIIEKITIDHLSESQIMKRTLDRGAVSSVNIQKYEILFFLIFFTFAVLGYFYRISLIAKREKEQQLDSLFKELDIANSHRYSHEIDSSEKIGEYCRTLAEKLNCKREFIEQIGRFAILYDIGKIGIAEKILRDGIDGMGGENEKLKKHVEIGYSLVKKIQLGQIAENMVRYHHERWDGKGYPLGLSGENIPLEARIISLCDCYQSMRIRDDLTHEEAIEEMSLDNETILDPKLVNKFLEIEEEFMKIYAK